MIVYFSGTGNSRYAAEMIADLTGDTTTDASVFIKSGEPACLNSDRPWVFVAPTYAWRIPRIFHDFIQKSSFAGDDRAYFFMTCGDDTGSAGDELIKLCREKNMKYMGLQKADMPENYVAMFSVPDEKQSERIIREAEVHIRQAAGLIAAQEMFPSAGVRLAGKVLTHAVNPLFYYFSVKAKKFYADESCTGCGKCVQLCPLNNITLSGGKPAWGNSCTHCMACICRCPAEAIEYGNASRGKRRYICPPYKSSNK